MPTAPTYPPERHVLRDLRLGTELVQGPALLGDLEITEPLCTTAGLIHAGVLATMVDVLGGGLAAVAAQPDWIATANLTLHVLPRPGLRLVTATAGVVRQGRTTVVVEVDLGADGERFGLATMTFAVLPRRDGNPVIASAGPAGRTTLASPSSQFTADYATSLGIEVRGGVATFAIGDYVRNSLGAAQGGVMATAAVAAATDALDAAMSSPSAVVDLQVTYLALAKEGPVCATASVLDADERSGTARVTLTDTDADDLVTTVARVRAIRVT